jgi:hypothetical protein
MTPTELILGGVVISVVLWLAKKFGQLLYSILIGGLIYAIFFYLFDINLISELPNIASRAYDLLMQLLQSLIDGFEESQEQDL